MNKKILVIIFLIVWGIYLKTGLAWADRQRPTGDEPHYLIMAQSLIADHDFDLKNNYDQKDYQKWGYPVETLDRHVSVNSRGGHQYPLHNIGWPIIISPFLALDGRIGITFLTSFLAALLFLNIFLLVEKITKNRWAALVISSVIGFSPPILIYSALICNEIFAALLVLFAFRKIIDKPKTIADYLLPLLGIAILPWIHIKYLLISLVLLGFWLWQNFSKKRVFLASIYLVSLFFLGYIFYLFYGSISPNAQYPSVFTFDFVKIGQGMLGLLLDRAFGIIPYTPVYFFVFSGLYFLYRKNKNIFWQLLIVFMSLFLIQSAGAIYIGWAPAGRFLTPILPLIALPLAYAYLYLQRWSKILFWHLALWGYLVGVILIRFPDLNYSLSEAKFLESISPKFINLAKFLPKLINVENYPALSPRMLIILIGWVIIILGLNLIFIYQARRGSRAI